MCKACTRIQRSVISSTRSIMCNSWSDRNYCTDVCRNFGLSVYSVRLSVYSVRLTLHNNPTFGRVVRVTTTQCLVVLCVSRQPNVWLCCACCDNPTFGRVVCVMATGRLVALCLLRQPNVWSCCTCYSDPTFGYVIRDTITSCYSVNSELSNTQSTRSVKSLK